MDPAKKQSGVAESDLMAFEQYNRVCRRGPAEQHKLSPQMVKMLLAWNDREGYARGFCHFYKTAHALEQRGILTHNRIRKRKWRLTRMGRNIRNELKADLESYLKKGDKTDGSFNRH